MHKVFIYVEGGNIHEVRIDKPIDELEVVVFDADNMEEEMSKDQIDQEWDNVSKNTVPIQWVAQ